MSIKRWPLRSQVYLRSVSNLPMGPGGRTRPADARNRQLRPYYRWRDSARLAAWLRCLAIVKMVAALALKKDNSSIPLKRLCNFADRAEAQSISHSKESKDEGDSAR